MHQKLKQQDEFKRQKNQHKYNEGERAGNPVTGLWLLLPEDRGQEKWKACSKATRERKI